MHAPPQKVINRAETLAPQRTVTAAGGLTLRSPYTSRFVGDIIARQPQPAPSDGKQMFRTSEGKLVELPPDITVEEAAQLEAEAKAAEKRLGKGPAPKPVPDVQKLAKKEVKKEAPKPKARGRGLDRGRGKAAPAPGAAVAAMLRAVGKSKVAQFLAMRGAPALMRGAVGLLKLRKNEQTHDDAGQKLKQSENAVVIPPTEGQSKSNTGQVQTVGDRPAPVVDEKAGRRKLQESLEANTPRSIEDVDNFKRDMKAQHTGADVMLVVQGDKSAVTSTFGDVQTTPPPAPPEHEPQGLPPEEIAPPTPALNLGQGTIAPLQKEHTDLSNYTKEADDKLKEEGVTQEQLDMVDSGDLAEANKEKKGMEKSARTEPLAVQEFARKESETIDKDLRQEENRGRDGVRARRKVGLGATAQKQRGTKSALEKKRDEVARKINDIYKRAQDSVKKKLADLETQSMKRFDEGNSRATREFEDNVNRELDAYKDERYSGWFGWARRAKDWLLGMDELPAVKAIFERNRAAFVNTIGKLVDDITADNKRVIRECKEELDRARKEIQEYVDKLGPELKGIGREAAAEMNSKLNELDQFVADKEQELQNKLKDKQTAAIKAIDEKIEKMKEAMSGALAKLGRLLLLAAKKFFAWALEKFGYSLEEIESIINKGVAVLKAIFTKPIQFVKNLVRAASTGFQNFAKNFLTHLKNVIFDWLAGSLEGIRLPDTWDLKGIASVALQMLGLTWTNIRAKLVKAVGETTVKALETGFELVVTLVRDGPMAAWEKIKEMAEDIKEAFIEGVKDFIKIKIVQKAVETILSLLIPGAGIVRAIVAIYDTIVFFIQKAKQIAEMVGNFLGSIGEIAAGNIGAAADALEKGLATALKLVINFLVRFLRLDGITAKIRAAIQKLRDKVDKMLDKVVEWIVTKAKKLFAAVTGKREQPQAAPPTADGAPEDLVHVPFAIGHEPHSLRTEIVNGQIRLRMSSSVVSEFSDRVRRIRDEWIPLRRHHPAGNLANELDDLARDGEALIVAANRRRTERARSRALNEAVNQLAVRLRSICQRFDMTRIEGITNYQEPPAHAPVYEALTTFRRAQGMAVTLSFRSRPFMRATDTSNVNIPGTAIVPGYDAGHLLAASLGGSNTSSRNYAPMSQSTNRSRGGIVLFEAALRTALRQDVFPPWIVTYRISCVYTGSPEELGAEVARFVRSTAPTTAGTRLFRLAASNAPIDAASLLAAIPGADPALVSSNVEQIRRMILMNFTPRRFAVDVQILQAPEGGRLPASSPFDNHM
jgi:hypothetical protein